MSHRLPQSYRQSTRTALLGLFALLLIVANVGENARGANAQSPRELTLGFQGEARPLPPAIFGGSAEALIEHLYDNPAKVAALKQTAPAVIRFPGGTQSNYYDWRTGQLSFPAQANSSKYLKFWASVAPAINRAWPQGVKMEQYMPMAHQIGADVILVPNLETSTITEQVEWFNQLAKEHILPSNIELGNEFWLAMGGDPNVTKKWPDEPTSMAVMHQYADALRPIVGDQAQFAVQASAATFQFLADSPGAFPRRLLTWDQQLAPDSWFSAVTVHLYPRPEALLARQPDLITTDQFALFMGRADSGVDSALEAVIKQVPGKSIWLTEWNPRGGDPGDVNNPNYHEMVPPPMRAQLVARYELAYLRHPEVTKALYFMLNFDQKSVFSEYVKDGPNYAPMAPALVIQWFNNAANAGGSFQRVIEPAAQPSTNIGPFKDSYRAIEGGLFKSSAQTILILQNASNEARLYDPVHTAKSPAPTKAELLVTTDLGAQAKIAAQITMMAVDQPFTLPPYSILRLEWR